MYRRLEMETKGGAVKLSHAPGEAFNRYFGGFGME